MRMGLLISLMAAASAATVVPAGAHPRQATPERPSDHARHGGDEHRCRIVQDGQPARACTPAEERRANAAAEHARRTVERLQPQIEAAQEIARRHRSRD